jgi:hypothetical protein
MTQFGQPEDPLNRHGTNDKYEVQARVSVPFRPTHLDSDAFCDQLFKVVCGVYEIYQAGHNQAI